MSILIVKSNNKTETYNLAEVDTQAVLKIKAKGKTAYELLNPETGVAPDHIVMKRVGQDLEVRFDEDSAEPVSGI